MFTLAVYQRVNLLWTVVKCTYNCGVACQSTIRKMKNWKCFIFLPSIIFIPLAWTRHEQCTTYLQTLQAMCSCGYFMQVSQKLCMAEKFHNLIFSLRTGTQPCTVHIHFIIVHNKFTHWHTTLCEQCKNKICKSVKVAKSVPWPEIDMHCLQCLRIGSAMIAVFGNRLCTVHA